MRCKNCQFLSISRIEKKFLGFLSKRGFHLFPDKLNKNTYTFPYRYQENNYFTK